MSRRVSSLLFITIAVCLGPVWIAAATAQEWFDLYERGLDALQHRRSGIAASLFERSIRQQPTPGTDLPTSGGKRLATYYPYVHLAEALATSGDIERARRALKRSEATGLEPEGERNRVAALLSGTARNSAEGPAFRRQRPGERPVLEARNVAEPTPASATTPTPASRPRVIETAAPAAIAKETRGELEITTTPGNADVYLDGEFIGRSDDSGHLVKREIFLGSHELRVGGVEGFLEKRETIEVVEQSQRIVLLEKQPQRVEAQRSSPGPVSIVAGAFVALGVLGLLIAKSRRTSGLASAATEVSSPSLAGPETALISTPPPSDPSFFGDYQLIEQLGKGGMASVFRARRKGEDVALKRPLASFLSETEFLERFVREAEIGRTLNHPNIIRILEKGKVGEVPYFTMELVDGETLHSLVRREGALSSGQACTIVKQVAEALDYSHMKGVIHRDLKPSNIMILRSGVAKVMDYGIARSSRFDGMTLTGAFLGTPEYIAPETADGGRTDASSDLYSLGVVFYEILTGVRPFVGDTPFATLKKICSEPPTRPSIVKHCPDDLERIVLKLLQKNPADRFMSAEELLNDINDFVNRAA